MPEGPTQTALLCQAQAACAVCWSEIGGACNHLGWPPLLCCNVQAVTDLHGVFSH